MDVGHSSRSLESAIRSVGHQNLVTVGSIQAIGLSGVREKLATRWAEWSQAVYGLIESTLHNQFGPTAAFSRSDDESYVIVLVGIDYKAGRAAVDDVAGKIQSWLSSAMPVSQTVIIRFHTATIATATALEACQHPVRLQRLIQEAAQARSREHVDPLIQDRRPSAVVYDSDNIDNVLSGMRPEEIDGLPFGVIKMDRRGKILMYNIAESSLSGRIPAEVIGRNFFKDIAPCTNRAEFLGRFVDGLKSGTLDVKFQYLFDFKMKPTVVSVHLRNSYFDDNVWVLIEVQSEADNVSGPQGGAAET